MNAARAGRREWIGLAVIALPCLLYSMDLTVLHRVLIGEDPVLWLNPLNDIDELLRQEIS